MIINIENLEIRILLSKDFPIFVLKIKNARISKFPSIEIDLEHICGHLQMEPNEKLDPHECNTILFISRISKTEDLQILISDIQMQMEPFQLKIMALMVESAGNWNGFKEY